MMVFEDAARMVIPDGFCIVSLIQPRGLTVSLIDSVPFFFVVVSTNIALRFNLIASMMCI
jgi:hypothetical protein